MFLVWRVMCQSIIGIDIKFIECILIDSHLRKPNRRLAVHGILSILNYTCLFDSECDIQVSTYNKAWLEIANLNIIKLPNKLAAVNITTTHQ